MYSSTFFLQAIINGVLIGGVYSLVAVGLNLIFGVMKIINFAHGALMMLGMYMAYWFFALFQMSPYLSLIIIIPGLFILGALIQKFLIDPILDAPEHNQLLLTLGVSLFLENFALFLWSPDYRVTATPLANVNWYIGELSISMVRVLAFGVSMICSTILLLVLTRTDLGKAIRAATEEREGAILMGINVRRIFWISFGIGAACAGVAGATITPFFPVFPHVGSLFVITAFVVVVLGGMGSFEGAFVGGLIIGVAESVGAMFLPGSMKAIVSFAIFILILLFKPTGLFGGRRG